MSRRMMLLCCLLGLLLIAMPVADAVSQGVQYTETTKVSMGGTLGRLVARMAGLNSTSTTSVTEWRQRSDEGKDESTIIDLDEGHIVTLDHKRKTYTRMTFADMAAMADRAAQQVQEAIEEAQASEDPAYDGQPESDVKFEFDVSVDRTGKRQRIGGADAEQVVMTIRTDVTDTSEEDPASGTFYVIVDSWLSTDIPGWEIVDTFYRNMSEKMGEQFNMTQTGEALTTAMQSDPRIGPAMERAQEELAGLEGTSVRTGMYMVIVAEGAALDRDKVLGTSTTADAEEVQPRRRGLGGIVRAARDLANQSEQADAEEQTQGTLVSIVTEMSEVKRQAIDPSAFSIPANYKMVALGE